MVLAGLVTKRREYLKVRHVVWAGPVATLSTRLRSALNRPKDAPVVFTGMEQVLAY